MKNNKSNQNNKSDRKQLEENLAQDLAFDQVFQARFNDHEITPSAQVWEKVRKKLPLNLLIKRQLIWLSKIAAVLMIGMLFSVLQDKKQTTEQFAQNEVIPPSKIETVTTPDFVFDLKEDKSIKHKRKKQEKIVKHSPDLEELWAELLDENENTDEDPLIERLIGPIENLPFEHTIALLPPVPDIQVKAVEENIDFVPTEIEIRIPLKIESSVSVE